LEEVEIGHAALTGTFPGKLGIGGDLVKSQGGARAATAELFAGDDPLQRGPKSAAIPDPAQP